MLNFKNIFHANEKKSIQNYQNGLLWWMTDLRKCSALLHVFFSKNVSNWKKSGFKVSRKTQNRTGKRFFCKIYVFRRKIFWSAWSEFRRSKDSKDLNIFLINFIKDLFSSPFLTEFWMNKECLKKFHSIWILNEWNWDYQALIRTIKNKNQPSFLWIESNRTNLYL